MSSNINGGNGGEIVSDIQKNANEYMLKRLKCLWEEHDKFINSLDVINSREEAYRNLIILMGKFLADMANLSEVVSEKDEKNIYVTDKPISLNTVMRKIPIVLGICAENIKRPNILGRKNKRPYYFSYSFWGNEIAKFFSTVICGSMHRGDYTTEADRILINSLETTYCNNLQQLYSIGFIKKDMIEKDRRRLICLERCIGDMCNFHGFLQHFYNICYPPETFIFAYGIEEEHWLYLPRHKEKSHLGDESSRVLAEILRFYPKIFEYTKNYYDQLEQSKAGTKCV